MAPDDADGYLAARTWGEGPDLVLVHGFTQSAACWGSFGSYLGAGHRITAVDLPGHGGSSRIVADLHKSARLVAKARGGPASYLGYSLGGRVLLHLALQFPEAVERLVLIGATPGIEDPSARAARRALDGALADELDPGSPEPTVSLDAFVQRWLGNPMFATLPAAAASTSNRLANDPAGLASSLRLCSTGSQDPLWGCLEELEMPVLVMAGCIDSRFSHLATRMARAIGKNATVALVAGAGHACHLERPELAAAMVSGFLGGRQAAPGHSQPAPGHSQPGLARTATR